MLFVWHNAPAHGSAAVINISKYFISNGTMLIPFYFYISNGTMLIPFYFYFSLFPYFASRSTYDLISCNPVVQCPSKIPLKCLWLRVYLPVHYHRFKWCIVEWCYYTLLSSLCWETVWKAKSVNSTYLHYILYCIKYTFKNWHHVCFTIAC